MQLQHQRYGKAKVRVMKLLHEPGAHFVKELDVSCLLQGAFDAAYTASDNASVIATDTMKNTINVFAHEMLGHDTEPFLIALARHFIERYAHVAIAEIEAQERVWLHLEHAGEGSPTNFVASGQFNPFAKIAAGADSLEVTSGIRDLLLLKTAESAFEGFMRDEFTTLPETGDRLLATRMNASWTYGSIPPAFGSTNARILQCLLKTFGLHPSPSVQSTLYHMAEAALAECSHLREVRLTMPNLHCNLIDLTPFGRQNRNELFVPTESPHGWIEAVISR
jgi:urate oxidase